MDKKTMGSGLGRKSNLVPLLFLLLLVSLTACNRGEQPQGGSVIREQASVENVTIIAIGKTPVKIHASVQGTYPNDCTVIYEVTQAWVEDVYEIRIMTKRPRSDNQCEQGPVPFEEIYEIPVYQLQAGEYIIDVNGAQESLVFAFDNE